MQFQIIRWRALYLNGPYVFFFTLLILFCSSANSTAAQFGSIKGKVVADIPDQRRIIPDVGVTLAGNTIPDKKLETISNEEGEYSFTGLTAGDYVITVEL